jgi:hypothetical protein
MFCHLWRHLKGTANIWHFSQVSWYTLMQF